MIFFSALIPCHLDFVSIYACASDKWIKFKSSVFYQTKRLLSISVRSLRLCLRCLHCLRLWETSSSKWILSNQRKLVQVYESVSSDLTINSNNIAMMRRMEYEWTPTARTVWILHSPVYRVWYLEIWPQYPRNKVACLSNKLINASGNAQIHSPTHTHTHSYKIHML